MTHDIKKMLRIIDKNLEILAVEEEKIKKTQTLVIYAKLSPQPTPCKNCGSTVFDDQGKQVVVKNGSKTVTVRLDHYQHMPTVMNVKKQRFVCKNCRCHTTAQSYFVQEHCSIARHVTNKIIHLLREKISMTLISEQCHVSLATVIRVLKGVESYLPKANERASLPHVLMVDEFRSHATNEDKMSFICADGDSGQLIDVLPTRKFKRLERHFNQFSKETREQVTFLVTDMNAPYFKLQQTCFPNAKLIIDRFHIVKHLNAAFNDFRVREGKKVNQLGTPKQAKKIKSNWKLFLKNRQNIDWTTYSRWRSFPSPASPWLTEGAVIDRLLSYSDPLKATYQVFHDLTDAFRDKEPDVFFDCLRHLPESIDVEFKERVQSLLNYEEGIRNALIYAYSNGKIEAKNTHIKTLKRVSYGFRSFTNMRTRIFLMNGLIDIK